MLVRQIDTAHPADVRRFIGLPFALYRDNPLWVPPLWRDMRLALNRKKHPFYRHSAAAFFCAERDGQPVGRIAVMDNHHYNAYQHRQTAFLGFFECEDDESTAHALFDSAAGWARGRGLNELAGPRGMLSSDAVGLLVEGFEHRPALGIPYNPAYYERLFLAYGFTRACDNLSGYLPGDHQLDPRLYRIAERVRERRGFWIKSFTSRSEMLAYVQRGVQVINQAFSSFGPEYYPVPPEETEISARMIVDVADPRLVKLVMKGDEIAGFIFAYHDISAALQRCRGRLLPLGWWHLLREPARTEWVNVNGLGLLPKYQGLGANALLYTALADTIRPFHFKHVDVVAVSDYNDKSRADMAALGVRWYKRHRYYSRAI